MINLLIFFSLYLSVPNNNPDIMYKTVCENQKEYILTANYLTSSVTINEGENNIFTGELPSGEVKAFYCYQNNLYTVIPEANSMDIQINLILYKLIDNHFSYMESINDIIATYSVSDNNTLIYYNNSDRYFYKVVLKDNFNDSEQFLNVTDYNLKSIFYSNHLNGIVYTNNNGNFIFKNPENEKSLTHTGPNTLYDVKKFNDILYLIFYDDQSRKIRITDENDHIYFEYSLNDDESINNAFIFINEFGIYSFLLFNQTLKLAYIPEFNKNMLGVKEADTNISRIFNYGNYIYYFKKNSNNTSIYRIMTNAGKPDSPVIENNMKGVLSDIPASFSFSNFNHEDIYFLSYNFSISPNESFNSVYYGDTVGYYNKNSDSQVFLFNNYFVFERDKPYYMRIKYNGILSASEYSYVRFIITDLGEITSFKIENIDTASTIYTNNEMVKAKLENLGTVNKIQFSLNENFQDNNEDILPINFEHEFNFILPSEEKEYTYYVRPVIFDNNNLIGGHQIKTAKIILDKTPPVKPEFTTENNKEFYKDNIEIKWEQSDDTLSGLNKYKIRLVDSLNEEIESSEINNTKNNFIPENNLIKGVYTLFLSACDNAENCTEESKLNFSIIDKENHKPYKPALIRPKNKDTINSMPFNISWSKSIDLDNDNITYSLIIAKDINFVNKESEIYLIKKLSQNITYLPQGHYYLKLFAIDDKGSKSEEEIIEFDVIEPNKTNSSSGCSFY